MVARMNDLQAKVNNLEQRNELLIEDIKIRDRVNQVMAGWMVALSGFALFGLIWIGIGIYHAIHDPYEAEHQKVWGAIEELQESWNEEHGYSITWDSDDSVTVVVPEEYIGDIDDHYISADHMNEWRTH